MSEIIDKFYTPLLTGHGFIRDPDNAGNFLPKLEKALTGLMDRKTFMTLRYTTFHSMKISCWNFLCRNV